MAGGLSNSVGHAWRTCASTGDKWWNISDNSLQRMSGINHDPEDIVSLKDELIDGHYRYCNEFLWPVLHNMEDISVFRFQSYKLYERFNRVVADALINEFKSRKNPSACFIHDYHFAFLPYFLKEELNIKSVFFWHIPWPKLTDDALINAQLKNIVVGLLHCEAIGFHTNEYAMNFLQFVESHLPEFICNWNSMTITERLSPSNRTEVMVAPLGIDYESWSALSQNESKEPILPIGKSPYIFSVDRTDYTKGVTNRLEAIDYFFERYPRWQQKIVFVQSCGRTREGLPVFDQYWDQCHAIQERVMHNWSTYDWQPIIWLHENLCASKLAKLYSKASVMLVNPIRDGLNLTAKEYVACQQSDPGALVLSPGAGVWEELGNYCLSTDPADPRCIADSINKALSISPGEKAMRMNLLKASVQSNNLISWWFNFKNKIESAAARKIINIHAKRIAGKRNN